ncbi:hypothetical protein ACFWY9_38925 [Amycolatopsis sp. NPDC059027]|uniref:hypothetical protein n=1 Tax=unclassified Amycolatopsis TaxID=2618356 RepID=UPI00366AA786
MRKTTLVAAGAALVLTLTACGGNSGGTGTDTKASGDGKGFGLAAPFSDALQLASASKEGTQKSKSAKMTMESSDPAKTINMNGAVKFDGQNTAMAMTMDQAGQQMEVRLVDKVLYMKMPPEQLQKMGTGKSWVKITPNGDDPISKAMGSSLAQSSEQSDPTKILEQIGNGGKIISSDQTQLNGEPVNHYVAEIDISKNLDKVLESAPAEAKSQLADKLKGVKMPVELWLNKDQLPVQMVLDSSAVAKAAGAPGGASEAGKITVKYTDWGKPVDVTAPPADQVADLSEMMKTGGR